MKAMILAAGQGTRVRPITSTIPKPMMPLVRKPVMEFLIEHLRNCGINEIVINTSHLAPAIENYFRDGERFGVHIAYSFEGTIADGEIVGQALGSAGGMRKIQDFSGFFDETFVVLCGDAFVDIDLSRLLDFHRHRKAMATIALRDVPREEVSKYGVVQLDDAGKVLRFQEKPRVEDAVSTTINTGIYLFEPSIFDFIPHDTPFDIGSQLFPAMVQCGAPLYGVSMPFTWVDIGSIPDYWEATRLLLRNGVHGFHLPGRNMGSGVQAGIHLRVNWDHVHIQGPVYIGSGTSIGNGATIIGPTVIGSNCVIEPGAVVRESILSDYTRVSAVALLEEKIVFGNKCIDPMGKFIDIGQSQIGWIVDDARKQTELSQAEAELLAEVQSLVTP